MTRKESRVVLEMLHTCGHEVKAVDLRSPSAVEETPERAVPDSCEETEDAGEPRVQGNRGSSQTARNKPHTPQTYHS